MVTKPRGLIGTPFKTTSVRVSVVTNEKIRGLIGKARMAKTQRDLRNLRDRIESRRLPVVRSAGAIE